MTISQVYLTNLVAKGFGSKLAKNEIAKTETFILASNSFTLWILNIQMGTLWKVKPFESQPTLEHNKQPRKELYTLKTSGE